jgi:hypothetical protein
VFFLKPILRFRNLKLQRFPRHKKTFLFS